MCFTKSRIFKYSSVRFTMTIHLTQNSKCIYGSFFLLRLYNKMYHFENITLLVTGNEFICRRLTL